MHHRQLSLSLPGSRWPHAMDKQTLPRSHGRSRLGLQLLLRVQPMLPGVIWPAAPTSTVGSGVFSSARSVATRSAPESHWYGDRRPAPDRGSASKPPRLDPPAAPASPSAAMGRMLTSTRAPGTCARPPNAVKSLERRPCSAGCLHGWHQPGATTQPCGTETICPWVVLHRHCLISASPNGSGAGTTPGRAMWNKAKPAPKAQILKLTAHPAPFRTQFGNQHSTLRTMGKENWSHQKISFHVCVEAPDRCE